MKYSKAFTLTELMVTLAVAGILAMAVVPFSDFIRKNRNATLVQEFATALNLARSEAIKRGGTVTVCKRMTPDGNPGEECDDAATWANGWVVYVDTDVVGSIRNTGTADEVIRVHQAIPDGYTFDNGGTPDSIDFKSSGLSTANPATYKLCDPSNNVKYAHGVVVSFAGRVRLSEDSNGDGIREGQVGVNLVCP